MKKLLLAIAIILCFASTGWGADYYFSTSGTDDPDTSGTCEIDECTTAAAACKSIECANDILDLLTDGAHRISFKDGETWLYNTSGHWASTAVTNEAEFLDITAAGTNDSNRLIIGCYSAQDTFTCSTKPKLDGEGSGGCRGSCDDDDAIIDSSGGEDYVTIQDLHIYDSDTGGVAIKGSAQNDGIIIQRLTVDETDSNGIACRNCDDGTLTENIMTNIRTTQSGSCTSGLLGGVAIKCIRGCERTTISYNEIDGSYQEGINTFDGGDANGSEDIADSNIIEYNKISRTKSYGIHGGDGSDIIRYNKIFMYDTGSDGLDKFFHDGGTWPDCTFSTTTQAGAISMQTRGANGVSIISHQQIYGNIIHSYPSGIGCGEEPDDDANDIMHCYVYNNTIIDTGSQFSNQYHFWFRIDHVSSTNYFKNNISVFYDTVSANRQHINLLGSNVAGMTGSYNLFYPGTAGSLDIDYQNNSSNDIFGTDPDLATNTGYLVSDGSGGLTPPAAINTFDGSEFALTSASPAINRGTNLGDSYDDALDPDNVDFTASPPSVSTLDQDTYTPWEIGAFVYSGSDHYIDCSATTSLDLGTFAEPWNALDGDVNGHTFNTGDDLYFKAGTACDYSDGTLTQYLRIDWSGTAVDPIEIGCYWDDGGSPNTDCETTSETRPIIDTDDNNLDGSGNVGIFNKDNDDNTDDYIEINYLHIRDTAIGEAKCVGGGIRGVYVIESDHLTVKNCRFTEIGTSAVVVGRSTDTTIEYNYIDASLHNPACGGVIELNCSLVAYTTNSLLQYNTILAKDEAIGIYRGCNSATVQYNTIIFPTGGSQQPDGVYIDASASNIVRYNLIYAAGDGVGTGAGLHINHEDAWGTEMNTNNNEFYGNLVAGTLYGISVGDQKDVDYTGLKIYNNTFVDNNVNIQLWATIGSGEIKNNISADYYGSGDDVSGCSNSSITWQHNLWDSNESGDCATETACVGGGDCGNLNDDTPGLTKTTDWRSLTSENVDGTEFALASGSNAVGAGTNLGSPYDMALDPDNVDFTADPISVGTVDQDIYTPWEIGAFVYKGADTLYCFSTSGNDSNDCLCSGPNWCKTVEKVNTLISAFSPSGSDDTYILFKEGDQWDYAGNGSSPEFENASLSDEDDYLRIDTGGTATSMLIIGAADSGGSYVATSSNRPIIDYGGNLVEGSAYNFVVGINASGLGPEYFIIENLEVTNSLSRGIFYRNRTSPTYVSGIIIRKNEVHKHSREGIFVGYNTDGTEISDNLVYDVVRKNGPDISSCTGKSGAAIEMNYGNKNAVITRNTVYTAYGECIGTYWNENNGSGANIIEYNRVYNCRTVGIHAGEGHTIARYNLVGVYDAGGDGYEQEFYGDTWPTCGLGTGCSGDDTCYYMSAMISMNSTTNIPEYITDSKFEIYGNLVFGNHDTYGGDGGTGISCTFAGTVGQDTIECLVYNNTVVDCYKMISTNDHSDDTSANISYVKNNIFAIYDVEEFRTSVSSPGSKIVYDYNLFSDEPSANAKGVNDPAYADPELSTQTGFQWPTNITTFTGTEFALTESSPAINRGTNLGSPYDMALDPDNVDFIASPPSVSILDQDTYTPWEIGAFGYKGAISPSSGVFRLRVIK